MVKFFSALLLVGCVSNAFAQLTFTDATIRLLPPGQKQTAGYLTIHNSSNTSTSLTLANSNISETVEFHTTMMHGEMMHMMQVTELTIPAQGKLELQPGGYHLMLINLADNWFNQTEIWLEFVDTNNNKHKIPARLSKMDGADHNHMQHDQHKHHH
ncbi:copper chaperone PCu(A)C [Catenovulum agarivorans]|uniref:copper chaperone PCu(A)C n=1 Tax=Catenovulum agarivorans TaxID=1172192 RepID=UPI0002DA7B26|nr:copper chaperone PCu(A)C [Catenovulum agarivorans]